VAYTAEQLTDEPSAAETLIDEHAATDASASDG